MDSHRAFYEVDARKLIQTVSGFETHDENFNICLHYALSHFADQRNPDVDWFKVRRRILGFCERFEVDSEHEKARNLHFLTSKFLHFLDNGSLPEKTCGFAMLSLLCNLAGCGKGDDSVTKLSESLADSGNVDDCINWSETLRADDIKCEDVSDDEESSWTDSEESILPTTLLLPGSPSPQSIDSGIGDTPDSCCPIQVLFPPLEPFRPYQPPPPPKKQVLLENFYWNPRFQETKLPAIGDSFDANFTRVWESHLSQKYPIYTPETNAVITERNVMREVLWMLHGVKKTYLFLLVNGKYHVRQHVHLPHYTEDTLSYLLTPMCQYGNMVLSLSDFMENVHKHIQFSECQTVKGYVNGLRCLVLQYMKALTACEKKIVANNEIMTFMKLKVLLKPEFESLQLLYNAHISALNKISESPSPFACAVTLLDFLWGHLSESNLWLHEKSEMRVILTLFLTTLHPYMNMLKNSIISSHLVESQGEFLLERNIKVNVKDYEFWQNGIHLRELPDFIQSFFLKPVFEDILLASKSIRMLCSFDSFFDELFHTEKEHCDLFSEFVQEFCKHYENLTGHYLKYSSNEGLECSAAEACVDGSSHLVPPEDMSVEDSKRYDSYLKIYRQLQSLHIKVDKDKDLRQQVLDAFDPSNLIMINSVIEETLLPCIQNACKLSKKTLVQAMKDKHQLMKHLGVMKMYYLMEAGDSMFSFYIEIFKKIYEGEDWKNNTFLNCMFKDAILLVDTKECDKLTFYIDESYESQSLEPLDELSCLNVAYNVGWPISVILNQDVQKAYCKIFQFLLKIKCAKYSLDDLYCITLTERKRHIPKIAKWWVRNAELPERQVIHGMYVLRMKLLHFVNGFHSYIMTEILYSSGIELNEKLEKAESLEDILRTQTEYVSSLAERCLLTSSHSYLWEHIQILLNLALKFQKIWRMGVENFNLEDIKSIEQRYSTSINLLMCYLNKPRKKHENIHLEVLAHAVSTKFQYPQVFSGSVN